MQSDSSGQTLSISHLSDVCLAVSMLGIHAAAIWTETIIDSMQIAGKQARDNACYLFSVLEIIVRSAEMALSCWIVGCSTGNLTVAVTLIEINTYLRLAMLNAFY